MNLQFSLEEEIFELIDNQDDYTRSDLQGRVSAIVIKALNAVKPLSTDLLNHCIVLSNALEDASEEHFNRHLVQQARIAIAKENKATASKTS